MRDIALVTFFVIAIPFMFKRPSLGVVMWVWLSVMNPHRLSYNFAYDLQFALATAVITIFGLVFTKEEKRLPLTAPVIALGLFTGWMCLTSLFPFHPGAGFDMWSRVMKIMLMTFVAIALIRTKQQIHWVLWAIVVSLAFYGVKGGIFTIATGGNYLVWGPGGSFIEGNNELALALVMVIPLMRYVQIGLPRKWMRTAMTPAMLLTAFAAIGSHSRGALVAIAAMGVFLWLKSRSKVPMGIALAGAVALIVMFMPDSWFTRMQTIETYGEDASAMGRINAWSMAFHMALDRPLGGGYDIYDFDTFGRYAPNPLDVHAAHSIYFQIMGEHGFVGLFLFLSIGVFTWLAASDAKRRAKGIASLHWVAPFTDMLKVSMIGYGVGGAFLSLAYFDVPYYVTVLAVAIRELVIATRKVQVPGIQPERFARRDRFGVVDLDDEAAAGVARPRPRADEWRGHGAYGKPALAVKAGDTPR